MSNNVKIRRCPHCAQLVHFEIQHPQQCCWNCSTISDFSRIKTGVERLGFRLDVLAGRALPSCALCAQRAPMALLIAAPLAALMLSLCNSFHITVVLAPLRNLLSP